MVDVHLQTTARMVRNGIILRFNVVSLREVNADGREQTRLCTPRMRSSSPLVAELLIYMRPATNSFSWYKNSISRITGN